MTFSFNKTSQRCRDRLSALPDEVLGEIIGRLNNIAAAVRTSVLSKRWRNLWTSIPIVSFTWPDNYSKRHRFIVDSTTAVLERRRGAAIRRLCCDLGCYSDYEEVPWLLHRLLQLNVEEIFIKGIPYQFGLSGLSNLRSLELYSVIAPHSDFGEELRDSALLHTLSLKYCQFREIKISNSSLKTLTIRCCTAENALLWASGILSLDLGVECTLLGKFNAKDLPSLCSASLRIRRCKEVAMLMDILRVLTFARRGKLLFDFEMKCKDLHLDLPTFCNLEHLEMGGNLNSKLQCFLAKSMLCSAPKLENMVLIGREMPLLTSSRNAYHERHAHLKHVTFKGFVGAGTSVFELMKFVSTHVKRFKMKTVLSFDA